jgi:hypothetical protein
MVTPSPKRLIVCFCLFLAGPAGSAMYTPAEMASERARIESRLSHLHQLLTLPQFLEPDAHFLATVRIDLPDVAPDGDPMGFSAVGQRVFMPLSGLKFIEDLTMAYAWRYHSGLSLEPFDEYLAMLRWKPEPDWPDGRYIDPLNAFGVPDRIWERDMAIGELGTSLRNEAWAFILAHELAHVLYRHPGNRVAASESQANERQADEFAMNLMERSTTIPMGAILFFQATTVFYASRADLPSDREYQRWQRERATHPVNADRLLAIAEHLQRWSKREENTARRESLSSIGDSLEKFAADLEEPAMQQLIARRGVTGDPSDLKER